MLSQKSMVTQHIYIAERSSSQEISKRTLLEQENTINHKFPKMHETIILEYNFKIFLFYSKRKILFGVQSKSIQETL